MKKYVLVGCGSRGYGSYAKPIVENYGDCAALVGVFDTNRKRAERVPSLLDAGIPVFDDFETMIRETKPDTVIVTSPDCTHDAYIIRAMELGCDVISEKPVTTDAQKAATIIEAKERTGKNLTVTFNLRFSPFAKRVKQYLRQGIIGDVLSVHFEWLLNTRHGADYFRRWHRERKNSGSLLIHKSTHHFDFVNWLLEDDPVAVNAFGTRRFYGPTREKRSERCLTCPYKADCEFYFDITQGVNKSLYLDCEDADGYYRDRCVFADEIDIEDSVSVNVSYSGGAVMSYSLTAHSPYEGFHLILNGTKGRMEIEKLSTELPGYAEDAKEKIVVYNREGEVIRIAQPKVDAANHGGSDTLLRDYLFRGKIREPELMQGASLRDGLMSIGIGIAANLSMKENRRVSLAEFFDGTDGLR
ncbi:MAG: Gfo/Idh/MocA family oxidoreductase [Clostridia bacterium]|nr:Gfo/Idh/MocA family oxidoreductase [Clostridia bacterium]